MPKEQRAEERFACEVVRRVLGATFTSFDDNSERDRSMDSSYSPMAPRALSR